MPKRNRKQHAALIRAGSCSDSIALVVFAAPDVVAQALVQRDDARERAVADVTVETVVSIAVHRASTRRHSGAVPGYGRARYPGDGSRSLLGGDADGIVADARI